MVTSYTIRKMEPSQDVLSGLRKTLEIWLPQLRDKELLKEGQDKENKNLKEWKEIRDKIQQEMVKTVIGKVESEELSNPVYMKCDECDKPANS